MPCIDHRIFHFSDKRATQYNTLPVYVELIISGCFAVSSLLVLADTVHLYHQVNEWKQKKAKEYNAKSTI